MEEPPDDRGPGNAAVAIAVILLLAIAGFLIHEYNAYRWMENCRIEGRRDCDPIPIPNR
jgi:hypothetical protein